MKFEYLQTVQTNAEIDIDDIGNCALTAYTDNGRCTVLIIDTLLGSSRLFFYGPFNKDDPDTPLSYVQSYIKTIEYSPYKLVKEINSFINNARVQITQVFSVTREEALSLCRNIVDLVKDVDF